VHQERNFDAGGLGGGKRLVRVRVGGNQTITVHNHPLIRVSGAIFPDPVHFTASIAGRDYSHERSLLKSVREVQNLLLLCRR